MNSNRSLLLTNLSKLDEEQIRKYLTTVFPDVCVENWTEDMSTSTSTELVVGCYVKSNVNRGSVWKIIDQRPDEFYYCCVGYITPGDNAWEKCGEAGTIQWKNIGTFDVFNNPGWESTGKGNIIRIYPKNIPYEIRRLKA